MSHENLEPDPQESASNRWAGALSTESRLVSLETKTITFATKEDLANLKVWILVGVVSAMITALIALGVVLAKFFLEN